MILTGFLSFFGCNSPSDPAKWNSNKINDWFEKGEWLNGWNVTPDTSINRREFVISYFNNTERWDKAFAFLKNSDLAKLELKKYVIDGDNLFATVSEYITKNDEEASFEAHHKYIDIQYVITGAENMGIAPVSLKQEILVPYDETNDIEFLTVAKENIIKATADNFVIFFPSDAHKPCLKVGENSQVRKIVLKVKVD